ncbi:hypothetical protein D3C87_1547590 [compost metagenome]
MAALTNVRDPAKVRPDAPSRGELVVGALTEAGGSAAFFERLASRAHEYNPFNLIAIDAGGLRYLTSEQPGQQELSRGIWSMSNGPLAAVWPKTARLKGLIATLLASDHVEPDEVLAVLADTHAPADGELPDTGVGIEWERQLAPIFICSPKYGTRCSTVVLIGYDGRIRWVERSYDAQGQVVGQVDLSFDRSRNEEPVP